MRRSAKYAPGMSLDRCHAVLSAEKILLAVNRLLLQANVENRFHKSDRLTLFVIPAPVEVTDPQWGDRKDGEWLGWNGRGTPELKTEKKQGREKQEENREENEEREDVRLRKHLSQS